MLSKIDRHSFQGQPFASTNHYTPDLNKHSEPLGYDFKSNVLLFMIHFVQLNMKDNVGLACLLDTKIFHKTEQSRHVLDITILSFVKYLV